MVAELARTDWAHDWNSSPASDRGKLLSSETVMAANTTSVNGRSTNGNRRGVRGPRHDVQTRQGEKGQ